MSLYDFFHLFWDAPRAPKVLKEKKKKVQRKLVVGLANFVHWNRKKLVDLGTAKDSWYKVG
jgi:hypothetical protein